MDLNEFGPILTMMAQQEERFIYKMNEIHEDVLITKKQATITNGRVNELEKKDLIRGEAEKHAIKERKYMMWKMSGMVIVAAILAALIMNFGILEFLKLIK